MNRKRNLLVTVTAALLSALLVYGVYVLQLRQVQFQETVNIVVPQRFVAAGERLSADMLGVKQIAKASYEPEMSVDAKELIGSEAIIPLGANEPLLRWKLGKFRLQPGRNQSTFQIPRDYVLSVSSGIRAGDKVIVYGSGAEADSVRLFDEPITVASVKTSGNLEIDDMNDANLKAMTSGDQEGMYAARRDANGVIDAINLNLTESQWLKLDALCKNGASKVVIAYSSNSLDIAASSIGEVAAP
ncbi:SAF domain-containing protein [Paenibacillus albus]|uniref:Flagellar biosynthesis protein FlgA n=1 Tax=Paenibacillus albus TaxID=2495582 RepID=A0A3S9ABU2_9BACL|nr:SAF domain-containing protein [Paenibacillus albus]AZN43213.1 flagellar biosynthesis protein FlgA [Paenibacillus albus]